MPVISHEILIQALSRMQKQQLKTQPLTTQELNELYIHLGIEFDKDGTILKINQDARILQYIENTLLLLANSVSLYKYFQELGAQLPRQDDLHKIYNECIHTNNTDRKILLLKPIISKLLTTPILLLDEVIKKSAYPNPQTSELSKVETSSQTHTVSTEEDEKLIESFKEATKLKQQVDECSSVPEKIMELYGSYYKTYKTHQLNSQQILQDALSRIKTNQLQKKPLTTNEIIELHRNLGIVFDKDGNILKSRENAPVIIYIKQVLEKLKKYPNKYEEYNNRFFGGKLPSQEELTKIYHNYYPSSNSTPVDQKENTQLIAPMIHALLQSPTSTPKAFVKKYKYPSSNDRIQQLLTTLTALLKAEIKNKIEINKIFQELYKDLGIKCYIEPNGDITLQKIKFNSPILPTDPKYKKYNIHFNKNSAYATRTNNVPLDIKEKKILGTGSYGKVIRAIGYNPKDPKNSLYKVAIKKTLLPSQYPTLKELLAKEVNILKKVGEYISAKKTMDKNHETWLHLEMMFKEGSPLNHAESSKLDFTKQIELMLSLGLQIQNLHEKQIRHNDLKGANIIVNSQNSSISVIDFGAAEIIDPNNPPVHETKGSPIYIAPEMLSEDIHKKSLKDYLASDIYSLGKVFIYDAGLHTLGIAYKMTTFLPQERPSIAEVISKLQEYQQKAPEITKQEQIISQITVLEDKVKAIKELFDKHDICSKEYYNILTEVLQNGTAEQLKIMQQLPMFNHLFKVDPIAQSKEIYKTQNIPFENKMLELFTYAARNHESKKIAFILIEHLCKNLENTTEQLWCIPGNIAAVLATNQEVAVFMSNAILEYLQKHRPIDANKGIYRKLLLIQTELSKTTNAPTVRPVTPSSKSDADSLGYPSDPESPTSTNRPQSRRSPRSR